jgi:hypothetical protein
MSKVTAEQRLALIRRDVAILLEQLPEEILKTYIEDYENVGTMLDNIEIASDLNNDEVERWIQVWYEVFRYDEEGGTETIADFDTEKQAEAFVYEYNLKHPDTELGYDHWQCNADGSGIARRNPFN